MNPTGKQKPAKPLAINASRVFVKAFILFLIINAFLLIIAPQPGLGRLSLYNCLFPGRERLPYGDNPSKAYNLSLYNLEAMFASHELAAGAKPDDEFRVIIIGDSSTWGFLLPAEETLSAQLNQLGLQTAKGETIRFYNLGFPVMSLTKDLLILSYAMRYEPDLIIWPLTLESFPYDKQLFPPLLQNNPAIVQELIDAHDLKLKASDAKPKETPWWEKTIFGQRRALADIIRLQLYGVLWAATGIDQEIPEKYTPRQEDLEADQTFHDLPPSELRSGISPSMF